jgi:hypothetical protein
MGGDGGVKATQRRFMRGTLCYTEETREILNAKEQRCRRGDLLTNFHLLCYVLIEN